MPNWALRIQQQIKMIMMSKILTNGDTIFWLSWKHCGKRRYCSLRAISSYPTMFSKVVCCWYVKMSIYEVKGLPTTTQSCILMHQRYMAVEKIVRKGEIACNKQFLLFSQCFLPCLALILNFRCTLKCRLQFVSIWTSLNFCLLVK